MIKRLLILFLSVSVLFVGAVFALRELRAPVTVLIPNRQATSSVSQFQIIDNGIDKEESKAISREVLLSSPLIIFGRGNATPFTPAAVISETNRQRVNQGLTAFTENELLNKAAEIKVRDMFEKQYFDHLSPAGTGPDSLARKVGYEYVSIGENLALGTFGDEGALVDAWMNSPGHRANILRPQFKEIGLAVGRGVYNGKQVLIAVQEFGRPISSCPSVSTKLKKEIDEQKIQLVTLGKTLEVIHAEINSMKVATNQDEQVFQNKITLYNNQVNQYNSLVASIKTETATYNAQVKAFNVCLQVSS